MPKYQFRFSTIPGGPDDEAYFIETETVEGIGVGSDHGFEWKWEYHDGIGTALLVVPDDPALIIALRAIAYYPALSPLDPLSALDDMRRIAREALGEHND